MWYIVNGTGGTIAQPTNPTSLFTGTPGNTYVLAWVFTDPCGTSYDYVTISFSTFTCGYPFIDARDNKIYNTVQIGSQCWMKDNLNYTAGSGSCGGNPPNCETYGRTYDWNTASTACPAGWHLPTDPEWCTLTASLDASVNCNTIGITGNDAGGKMKETGYTYWQPPNTGATNSSGFSARGAGSSIGSPGQRASFWTSSAYLFSPDKWSWELLYNDPRVFHQRYNISNYMSVRCLKN
jgi:uncharacterized protein (TIGR02145 family)